MLAIILKIKNYRIKIKKHLAIILKIRIYDNFSMEKTSLIEVYGLNFKDLLICLLFFLALKINFFFLKNQSTSNQSSIVLKQKKFKKNKFNTLSFEIQKSYYDDIFIS